MPRKAGPQSVLLLMATLSRLGVASDQWQDWGFSASFVGEEYLKDFCKRYRHNDARAKEPPTPYNDVLYTDTSKTRYC